MKPTVGYLTLSLALTACSAVNYQAHPRRSAEQPAPAGSVALYVANDHAEDVRLYVVRGSTRIPIGSVSSNSSRRFVIPPAQVGSSGELQLVAEALGSRGMAAPEALDIQLGAEVEFRIENNLKYSRLLPRIYRP